MKPGQMSWIVIILLLPFSLPACGYKGKLKSPSQIEAQEKKQAEKKAKEEEKKKGEAREGSEKPVEPVEKETR
jgi:predicted small lipoprotein YifL